ncbi:MAG TPA: hypothetical protein VHI52_18670, partial [Verrucomicrobiae bacterium]|nr:hypothetical protein [Verrucomicrobiae bacterium]
MKPTIPLLAAIMTALSLPCAWAEPPAPSPSPSPSATPAAQATPKRDPELFPEVGLGGLLDGQMQIEGASARPPTKSAYLVYAAALDRYATDKAQLLKGEPVLQRLLYEQFRYAYSYYAHYSFVFQHEKPVVNAKAEALELNAILTGGYKGMLADEIKSYASQLEATGEPAAEPQPEMQWGQISPGQLSLGLRIDGNKLTFSIENHAMQPAKELTHMETGETGNERQYDCFSLLAINSKLQAHEFLFTAPRKKATPAYQTIGRGEIYTDTIDLSKWYNRQTSGILFGYEQTWTLVLIYHGDTTAKGKPLSPPLYSG